MHLVRVAECLVEPFESASPSLPPLHILDRMARIFQHDRVHQLTRSAGASLFVAVSSARSCCAAAVRPSRREPSAQMQHGLASYYGPGFHGRRDGQRRDFDQRDMVAAHRTLPLGTVVRVTNLENGRAWSCGSSIAARTAATSGRARSSTSRRAPPGGCASSRTGWCGCGWKCAATWSDGRAVEWRTMG